jgi:hypothetical protein
MNFDMPMLEDFYEICMSNYDFSSVAPIANQDLDNDMI